MEKHLIIGPGVIGKEVFQVLQEFNREVYLSGRAKSQNNNYIQMNALNPVEVLEKTKNFTHVYITIGLPYNQKIWKAQWPMIIESIIQAGKANRFKTIFFDNVYAYGALNNPINENHELSPNSQKGITRKNVDEKLINAMNQQHIMIVRSPDFFGPGASNSVCYIGFLENMIKGKQPVFIGLVGKKHSYAYTKDIARAIVELALQEDTYKQTWHLPCYQTDSINEMLDAYNRELTTDFKLKVMSRKSHKMLSLFIPILKELYEMRYQFDNDYILDFTKYSIRFPNYEPTRFENAIQTTALYYKEKNQT
jgi:nucleoside-diphosphate-sugar epimerase